MFVNWWKNPLTSQSILQIHTQQIKSKVNINCYKVFDQKRFDKRSFQSTLRSMANSLFEWENQNIIFNKLINSQYGLPKKITRYTNRTIINLPISLNVYFTRNVTLFGMNTINPKVCIHILFQWIRKPTTQ